MADSKTAGRKRPPHASAAAAVVATTTSTTAATSTTTAPSTGANATNKKYQSQRTALQEMGFEMHDISTALDTTSGDLDAAMAILLGEPVNGGATRTLPPMKLVVTGKTTTSVKVVPNKIVDMREVHNKFMAVYKVQKCKEKGNHDKRLCFGFHTAGDRRRNPFDVLVPYICTECATPPTETTNCPDGDGCLKSHNMLERMFHPELFKISMCQRGPNGSLCERGNLCAFAHSDEDMRLPLSHTMGKQTLPPSPALSPMATTTNAVGTNKETTTFLADGSKSMDNNRTSKHGYGDDKLSGMNEALPPAVIGVNGTGKPVTSWANAVAASSSSSSQPPASVANTTVSNPSNDTGTSADGTGRSRRRGPSGPLSNLSLEADGPGPGPGPGPNSLPVPSSVSLLRSTSNETNGGVGKPYYPSESVFGDVTGMDLRASHDNSSFGMANSISPSSPGQGGLANYAPGILPSSPERNNSNNNGVNVVTSSPSGLRRRGPPIDFLDLSASAMNNSNLAGGGMAIAIPGTPGATGPPGPGIGPSTSMAELSEKFQQVTQMQQLYLSQMNNLQNELGVKSRECADLKRLIGNTTIITSARTRHTKYSRNVRWCIDPIQQ